MKEFDTAVALAEEDESSDDRDNSMVFYINEKNMAGEVINRVECRAYRPSDGQLAVLMATSTRHSSTQEQIAGLINFFVAVLDSDSHHYVVNRLLDRKDEFGIAQVQSIMEWMTEEWSGRPTRSSSVSTPSPASTGPRSTALTPAST